SSRSHEHSNKIDEDVWDRKEDLKEPYEYLLRLPITKNPEDSLTTEEKRIFMNGRKEGFYAYGVPSVPS
ncbi:MAG: hypothetical protein M1816_005935, partial [Peltula sp. TS41687]